MPKPNAKAKANPNPKPTGDIRPTDPAQSAIPDAELNLDLLRRLCQTPGIPGREERVRELIAAEIAGLFDEITTDPMGTLIARRAPRPSAHGAKPSSKRAPAPSPAADSATRPRRVMLLCHMDEIGFHVRHVDDNGFLWLDPAGGFDPRNLFSRRVLVVTKEAQLRGVMNPGGKPIHISTPEERNKVPEPKDFYVDIGLPADRAKAAVAVGDYVVMDEPFIQVGDKLVSKALDNRVACWLGIEAVRRLDRSASGHAAEVYVAFTTQEEVGLRGARAAAYAVRPDIGIGIDVTLACDTPGVPDTERVTKQGLGFGLHLKDASFIADHALVAEFEALALKNDIPYQRTILARGGQDGAAAQQAAAGARAIGITVGTRYIHTVTEMIDRTDLKAARDILAAYMASA